MAAGPTIRQRATGLPIRSVKATVVEGPDVGASFAAPERVTVGTAAGNDLTVKDPTVSRFHLELTRRGDRIAVADLGSTNGTLLAGARLERAEIAPGSVLALGATRLKIEDGAPAEVELLGQDRIAGLRGESASMRALMARLAKIAPSDAGVLVLGESGTGKERIASAIHELSPRKAKPFVVVDCGALTPALVASELFGHEKGSFTGAERQHQGFFERASGGTLFLDEITEMPLELQVKLLRVLESFAYMRIGGKKERQANVRVVAATNRDLMKMTEENVFREDLYYRLNILQINLPPLRERREDVALLATEFMAQFAQHYRKPMQVVPADTQRLLEGYHWPGNVRELRNVIEQAVLLARGVSLDPELLPQMIYRAGPVEDVIRIPLGATMRDAEKEIILRTLEARKGNKKITAEVLGISRRSLYNKLAEYGLDGK